MNTISVRNVNTFVFCPRLLWIEHVGGEFEANEHTIEGDFVHRRVDKPGGKLNAPDDGDEPWHARSLWLSDDDLALNGKLDLVDVEEDGTAQFVVAWLLPSQLTPSARPSTRSLVLVPFLNLKRHRNHLSTAENVPDVH